MPPMIRRAFIALCSMALVAGCAPNGGAPQPTMPWNRQVPPQAADNPWALPGSSSASSSYLSDWIKRTDQQQNLTPAQRQRLEELQRQLAALEQRSRVLTQQQREQERMALAAEYARKEKAMLSQVDEMKGRSELLHGRAGDLDANNRDLHAQIARGVKENGLLKEEVELLRNRLQATSQQLARTQQVSQESNKQLQALQASTRRKAGASITANNSLTKGITAVMVPGMDIRQDGDLVRISMPADKLFMLGTATLHQGSQPYMDQVARVILEHYPRQMAGIEAYTDHNTDLGGTQWRNRHQLTSAQSMAVFEQLTSRNVDPNQLFVIGHGGNHPKFSDGTPQGQSLNRRVEVVIYPETYPPR